MADAFHGCKSLKTITMSKEMANKVLSGLSYYCLKGEWSASEPDENGMVTLTKRQ